MCDRHAQWSEVLRQLTWQQYHLDQDHEKRLDYNIPSRAVCRIVHAQSCAVAFAGSTALLAIPPTDFHPRVPAPLIHHRDHIPGRRPSPAELLHRSACCRDQCRKRSRHSWSARVLLFPEWAEKSRLQSRQYSAPLESARDGTTTANQQVEQAARPAHQQPYHACGSCLPPERL